MKLLFRLYLLSLFSLVSFSYYAYGLDTNFKDGDPTKSLSDEACGDNGTLDSTTEITQSGTFINGHSFKAWKSWYKDRNDLNVKNLPYYIQSDNNSSTVGMYVHGITQNSDDTFNLNITQFQCTCIDGHTSYGTCHDEGYSTGKVEHEQNLTANDVCQAGNTLSGVSHIMHEQDKKWYNAYNTGNWSALQKTWPTTPRGDEDLFYSVPYGSDRVVFIKDYESTIRNEQSGFYASTVTTNYFQCECPYGIDPNTHLCKPLDCDYPNWEYPAGTCSEPDICPDGGVKLAGSCDRSCEDVGLFTSGGDSIDQIFNDGTTIVPCDSYLNCSDKEQQCISKCGSADNIDSSNSYCNASTGSYQCKCKDDNLDDQITNPDEIDENSTDNEITNSILGQIRDDLGEQTRDVQETNSLLISNNESQIRQEEKLTSIDGKLSNIDGSIQNMNTNISDMKDSIDGVNQAVTSTNSKIDESNGWLEGILGKISELYDYIVNINDTIESESNRIKSQIDNDIANLNNFDELNVEGQTQGYLDSVVSSYTNALGFSSSYGSRPSNITVTIYDKEYTIIDFSVLDEHISTIRNLFLSLAYLAGFILLLRKD